MNTSRVVYTAFVAFVSVVATLVVVALLGGEETAGTREGSAAKQETEEPVFTLEEVNEHDSAGSCWKAIDGVVYDLTEYIPRHPSDEEVFLRWCGREATEGWYDKGDGRPHSPRAQSMLAEYRIGVLEEGAPDRERAEPEPQPTERAVAGASEAIEKRVGEVLLSLSPGEYLDGHYRGNFIDRGDIQVSLTFNLRDGRLSDLNFRHLYYGDVDYLALDEDEELYAVMRQHRRILQELEGQPLRDIFRLYQPEDVVEDIDGYSGATLRGAKIIYAIRDGLNRGVYSW